MISKQASILPRRLIRRYHTNDPFEIAAALDITVMERSDFQRQKGAFKSRPAQQFHFYQCNDV